ncbi:MAG: hypothetical protein U5K43_14920 [Halofilum sp. (in: g-proteobacteria)]|nr:hypothetical protein [Halofilum sp. (in: g-proteobacteria)]
MRAAARLRGVPAPHDGPLDRAHQRQRLELQAGLQAGAEHRRDARVGPRQVARGDRARGRGAQVGEPAVVQQGRLRATGLGREQRHHARQAGQALLRVVEEPGADLHGEAVEAAHPGHLDVAFGVALGHVHRRHRRHDHLAAVQRRERAGDGVDRARVQPRALAQLRFGENADRHRVSSRGFMASTLQFRRSRCSRQASPGIRRRAGEVGSSLPDVAGIFQGERDSETASRTLAETAENAENAEKGELES